MEICEKDGWLSIEGPFESKDIRALGSYQHIDKLSLTHKKNHFMKNPVTVKISEGFRALKSVSLLSLWLSVNRTAMRNIITIPNLESLYILDLCHPGKLVNFKKAAKLKEFLCSFMSENDLLEISNLPVLEDLSAQNAKITPKTLEALLCVPTLKHLDLEASEFDDCMANILAKSSSITHLDVGATKLTSKGLKIISTMQQLQSLDIWALNIKEKDLELLFSLPYLEYFSIGGVDEQTTLTSKGVIPRLKEMRSLKRVWLDGISLSPGEKAELEKKIEYVRN
jgi:Leucine-rich repeat (LRR) protein